MKILDVNKKTKVVYSFTKFFWVIWKQEGMKTPDTEFHKIH